MRFNRKLIKPGPIRAFIFDLRKLKFLAAGIVNTAFSYIFFAFLIYLQMRTGYALFLSTIAGVIFNYYSYKGVVFKKKASLKGFIKHSMVYCIIYTINVGLLGIISECVTSNIYFAQLICLPLLVLISWIFMNKWVFK